MTPALRPLVLLVEDSDDVRELIAECLSSSGFDVRPARDAFEALRLAKALPLPDVVLLDLGLPDLDGLEAARRLQADARTRDIPIVALSAHALAGSREKALAAGCDEFDTKPIEFERLVATLRRLLADRE